MKDTGKISFFKLFLPSKTHVSVSEISNYIAVSIFEGKFEVLSKDRNIKRLEQPESL